MRAGLARQTDVVGNFPLSVISPRLWVLEYSSKSVCHTWDVPGRINAAGLDIVFGCTCGRPHTDRTVFATKTLNGELISLGKTCSENTFPMRKHISFTFFNLQPRMNKRQSLAQTLSWMHSWDAPQWQANSCIRTVVPAIQYNTLIVVDCIHTYKVQQ